jgi:hypothetical protein
MFSKEFWEILAEIITSWQVIVITVVLIIYMNIVSYVARAYHHPRIKKMKIKKGKPEPAMKSSSEEYEGDSNDDLGLEEE